MIPNGPNRPPFNGPRPNNRELMLNRNRAQLNLNRDGNRNILRNPVVNFGARMPNAAQVPPVVRHVAFIPPPMAQNIVQNLLANQNNRVVQPQLNPNVPNLPIDPAARERVDRAMGHVVSF